MHHLNGPGTKELNPPKAPSDDHRRVRAWPTGIATPDYLFHQGCFYHVRLSKSDVPECGTETSFTLWTFFHRLAPLPNLSEHAWLPAGWHQTPPYHLHVACVHKGKGLLAGPGGAEGPTRYGTLTGSGLCGRGGMCSLFPQTPSQWPPDSKRGHKPHFSKIPRNSQSRVCLPPDKHASDTVLYPVGPISAALQTKAPSLGQLHIRSMLRLGTQKARRMGKWTEWRTGQNTLLGLYLLLLALGQSQAPSLGFFVCKRNGTLSAFLSQLRVEETV